MIRRSSKPQTRTAKVKLNLPFSACDESSYLPGWAIDPYSAVFDDFEFRGTQLQLSNAIERKRGCTFVVVICGLHPVYRLLCRDSMVELTTLSRRTAIFPLRSPPLPSLRKGSMSLMRVSSSAIAFLQNLFRPLLLIEPKATEYTLEDRFVKRIDSDLAKYLGYLAKEDGSPS